MTTTRDFATEYQDAIANIEAAGTGSDIFYAKREALFIWNAAFMAGVALDRSEMDTAAAR